MGSLSLIPVHTGYKSTQPEHADEQELEERVLKLSEYARSLALRYQNPFRFPLEKEEIWGELNAEIAKAVVFYPDKPAAEFIRIARGMLWNRLYELLNQAYGSIRGQCERTAYMFDHDIFFGASDKTEFSFILSEFLTPLSPLARQVVECLLNPDEKMEMALLEYIEHRETIHWCINGVPPHVVAKALGRGVWVIRKAYQEIREALQKSEKDVDMFNSDAYRKSVDYPDFENSRIVEGVDYFKLYQDWPHHFLDSQLKYRKLWREDMTLQEKVDALQADDKKPVEVPVEEKSEVSESETSEPIEEKSEEIVPEVETAVTEEEPGDDYEEFPPLAPIKKTPPDWVKDDDVEPVSAEPDPIPAKEPVVEKVTPEAENKDEKQPVAEITMAQVDIVFVQMLEAMRKGEQLIVERLSEHEWSFTLVPTELIIVEVPQSTTKRYKKGSADWKKEVCTPERLEAEQMIKELTTKDMSPEEVIGIIKAKAQESGVTLPHTNDPRVLKTQFARGWYKEKGIETYKPEYKTQAARDKVTT